MSSYATVEDLEKRWRPLTDAEKARAQVLLEDASLRIRQACKHLPEPDADGLLARKIVACNMVMRAMSTDVSQPIGASSLTQTAGSFSQSTSWSGPASTLYLSKEDKILLGIGYSRAANVNLIVEPK